MNTWRQPRSLSTKNNCYSEQYEETCLEFA